jgi:AhpD family alkylhydroperoxidase
MAFIKTISVRNANDELRSIYRMIRSDTVGSLPFPVKWTTWHIMQALSLRPRLVWAFERGFRHVMWDGRLRRLAKEAIGVSVAQTNACPYCREAHVGFLEAAGMSARLTRVFESHPLAVKVAPDLQAFVELAVKVTARPSEVTPEDIGAAFASARSPREYFDAAGVMIAFNFSTRVANALGVEPEIPGWMRRIEPLRQIGLRAIALYCRLFVDLGRKKIPGPTPSEHLAALRALFIELRLGDLPVWVERLTFAPPLLATLRELLEALIRKETVTGTIGLDANLFTAIGRTVLRSIPNAKSLKMLADNLQPAPCAEADSQRTALITRFANDVALRSYTLTQARIDELRAANLDDAEVLDVVVTTALWSAAARLEVLTSSVPALDPTDENDKQGRCRPHSLLSVQVAS